MVVSRYRKWRRLSLCLVILVLVGTLSLLSHLWTSTPGGQKDLLHQDYSNPLGILLHNNKDRVDPGGHSSRQDTVPRHNNNQPVATPHDENKIAQDDKNAIPLIDNKNAVPLDDNHPTAVPRDKPQDGNQPDDNRPDGNQPDAVPPDDNKAADRLEDSQSDEVQPDDKSSDASLREKNKTNAAQLGNNKPTVLENKVHPDSVPRDINHPDEAVLRKKRRNLKSKYDQISSFHRENGTENPSKADPSKVDPSVNRFQRNAAGTDFQELGRKSPIKSNLSVEEFVGRTEENARKDKVRLPTLPRNRGENVDSSARVDAFESAAQVSSGNLDVNTNKLSRDQDTLHENNVNAAADDKEIKPKHILFPPGERIRQNLGTRTNQDLFYEVHDEERHFKNSTFQLDKSSEAAKNEFDRDSFLDSAKNEMNKNDFAADANQNADIPLPTKSAFPEADGDHSNAGSNSKDEFDSGIKFARQNFSNSPGNFGTSDVVKTVSMSLYGSEPRYTMGAIRNAELVKENFPGWTLRIYMESPASSAPRFGPVPRNIVEKLLSLGADIHYIVPEQDFIPPMMWRFLVADDLSVDCFIIRDSDSRLTERDAAAVSVWIRSGKPFHSIRDHPSHASYAVSGGLWGGRTKELRDILRRSWIDLMRGTSSNYLEDMNFLNGVVWPRVQHHAYCSDSVSCDRWPNSHPFPVVRYGYDHVGQVFNEHDLGRPVDIRILRVAGENARCAPTDVS